MAVDAVVRLMQSLETADRALERAVQGKDADEVDRQLNTILRLRTRMRQTEAMSAPGAAILLCQAAGLMSRLDTGYAERLRRAALRLAQDDRSLGDLMWLRGAAQALGEGLYGERGHDAAALMRLALKGAARPVGIARCAPPVTASQALSLSHSTATARD